MPGIDTYLHILEILSILVGGLTVAYRIGRTHTAIEASIGRQVETARLHANEIADLKLEIRKLGDVLTALAVQETRLDMHDKWIDELRHGVGLVVAPDSANRGSAR